MTESFVTQCPHCQTSFRVSYHQLSLARGAVRCGSCLQVFNAARQLLEQSTGQSAAALFGEGTAPVADSMAQATAPVPTLEAPTEADMPLPGNATRVEPISQRRWAATAEIDLDRLDLDDELARLEHRDTLRPDDDPQALPREESLSASRDERTVVREDAPVMAPRLGELRPGSEPGEHNPPRRSGSADGQRRPRRSAVEAADESLRRVDAPPLKSAATAKVRRAEPKMRDDDLPDLSEDPLQLQWQQSRSSWGKRLLWGALSLLAAALLAGQYVVYQFDELARQDAYRPWFQQLCPMLGCEVPSKVDIALIKSSNLMVRSHPQFNGALIVDAIIYNRAAFSQPFPLLELRFADLDGKLIASRRFKPSEYLGGDLAGQNDMPPQTPIHIALDILDPGNKAVNYSLSFQSPE